MFGTFSLLKQDLSRKQIKLIVVDVYLRINPPANNLHGIWPPAFKIGHPIPSHSCPAGLVTLSMSIDRRSLLSRKVFYQCHLWPNSEAIIVTIGIIFQFIVTTSNSPEGGEGLDTTGLPRGMELGSWNWGGRDRGSPEPFVSRSEFSKRSRMTWVSLAETSMGWNLGIHKSPNWVRKYTFLGENSSSSSSAWSKQSSKFGGAEKGR